MVIGNTRSGIFFCTYSSGKGRAGKERERASERAREKNYFGTSGYSQEDIAAAVLFADNLSRGDIYTYTAYFHRNRYFNK